MIEDETGKDLSNYTALVALWQGENPIKTLKLQVLLAVNAGLIAVVVLNGGLVAVNAPLCACGLFFSLIWTLSIGRTVLSQQAWKIKLGDICARHPGDARFSLLETRDAERRVTPWLRAVGSVPSKYYLVAGPAGLTVVWLMALTALVLG
jgi:hypothetical protein